MASANGDELTDVIREIRDRVRSRYPSSTAGPLPVPLPDLLPVLHARDAAAAKVASIGSVNPRPPGLANKIIQAVKKTIARSLGWFVRDQVSFNRGAMACVDATLEALNDVNRALKALAGQFAARLEEQRTYLDQQRAHLDREIAEMRSAIRETGDLRDEARQLADVRKHWSEWRVEWERKLSINEVQFLRSVADLQAGFSHRTSLLESNFRQIASAQHRDFEVAMERSTLDIQKRMWADLDRIRTEYEKLIHNELRTARQKMGLAAAGPAAALAQAPEIPEFDYWRFADRFRGSEEWVREGQRIYVPYFAQCRNVLDVGCGRGEFLDLMKEAGVPAKGIDLGPESIARCRQKGHSAEVADMFDYLGGQADLSLDGIFCAQVVEHLAPARVLEFVRLAAAKLDHGGVLAIETPNPECLAIFATHFYLDPTHTRPVPPLLLAFYCEESGIGRIEIRRLAPAVDSMPAVGQLPVEFRKQFFDGLDYAIVGRRL